MERRREGGRCSNENMEASEQAAKPKVERCVHVRDMTEVRLQDNKLGGLEE